MILGIQPVPNPVRETIGIPPSYWVEFLFLHPEWIVFLLLFYIGVILLANALRYYIQKKKAQST